jgi:hypothetical protein
MGHDMSLGGSAVPFGFCERGNLEGWSVVVFAVEEVVG